MSSNPYAAPKAAVADQIAPGRGTFIPGGRGVAAGRGMAWISEGWDLFRRAPGTWIGMMAVLMIIFAVLAFIPIVGSIATMVLWPVFAGGWMLGCRALDEGGELEFSHLFAGFREKFGTLAAIGALYLAGILIAIVIAMLVTGAGMSAVFGLSGGERPDPSTLFATMGLSFLIAMALILPLVMAIWLAKPLAVMNEHGAFEAMKGSFTGCLKNIIPFLLYGIVMLVLSIVASIPMFLGILLLGSVGSFVLGFLGWLLLVLALGPVLMASIYTAYRDIYFSS